MQKEPSDYLFVGEIREEYCIDSSGRVYLGALGGNAVYAAVGARIWSSLVALVGRVGNNFPPDLIKELSQHEFDIHGIRKLPEPQDTRTFYACPTPLEYLETKPASHFLRLGIPLPKKLLDYQPSIQTSAEQTSLPPLAPRPNDLPPQASDAKAAHISPTHYLSQISIPVQLHDLGVCPITLDPSKQYMQSGHFDDLPMIINGLDAFLPNEEEAKAVIQPHGWEIWDIAQAFSDLGCRFIVIKCGSRGQYAWDSDSHSRFLIPAYPARVMDVYGAGDAYCGGFLVGLDQTGDIVEAALRGSVSASIVIEGTGAYYALDVLPELAEARLESLRPAVKRV